MLVFMRLNPNAVISKKRRAQTYFKLALFTQNATQNGIKGKRM